MITTGPVSLALNAISQLADPTAQYGNPARAVQLQNSSVFVIEVSAGGSVYTIQPFVAQTVPLAGDGAGIVVLPSQNPTGSSASSTLTAVWLLAGESPPMDDGPLTSAAIIAAIAGAVSVGLVTETILAQANTNFRVPITLPAIPATTLSVAVWIEVTIWSSPPELPSLLEATWSQPSGLTPDTAYTLVTPDAVNSLWQVVYLDVVPGTAAGSEISLAAPSGFGTGTTAGPVVVIGYSVPAAMIRAKRYLAPSSQFSAVLNASSLAVAAPLSGAYMVELDPAVTVINSAAATIALNFTDAGSGLSFAVCNVAAGGGPTIVVPRWLSATGFRISSAPAGTIEVSGAYRLLPANGAGVG